MVTGSLTRRIDEATPADVIARATARIKQIQENIVAWEKSIADAEAELKQWQAIAGKARFTRVGNT